MRGVSEMCVGGLGVGCVWVVGLVCVLCVCVVCVRVVCVVGVCVYGVCVVCVCVCVCVCVLCVCVVCVRVWEEHVYVLYRLVNVSWVEVCHCDMYIHYSLL